MSTETGGPAYPVQDASAPCAVYGMTLLDAFAISAMQGILAGDHPITHDHDCAEKIARTSYALAYAMLAEKRRLEGAE